jgi:hypothetical protein
MAGPTSHCLTCRVKRGTAVLALRGPLTAQAVESARAAVRRGRWRRVIFDLAGACCCGPRPAGDPLRALLAFRHRLRAGGGRLVLCGLPAEVAELFRATWLLGLFEVQPDVAAARATLTA